MQQFISALRRFLLDIISRLFSAFIRHNTITVKPASLHTLTRCSFVADFIIANADISVYVYLALATVSLPNEHTNK